MNTEQARMVEDCEAREELLDAAEVNFLDDIGHRQRDLSQKQHAWLERIWERVTGDAPCIVRRM